MKPDELINIKARIYSKGTEKVKSEFAPENPEKQKIIEDEINKSNIVIRWRIKKEFCENDEAIAEVKKKFQELLEKLMRMGRNIDFTIRKYVDSIDWTYTIEKISPVHELVTKKISIDDQDSFYLVFRANIKEGEVMEEIKEANLDFLQQNNLDENFEMDICSSDQLSMARYLEMTESLTDNSETPVRGSEFQIKLQSDFLNYSRKQKNDFQCKIEEQKPKMCSIFNAYKIMKSLTKGNLEFVIGGDGNISELVSDLTDICKISHHDLKFEKKVKKVTRSQIAFKEQIEAHLYPDMQIEYRPHQSFFVFKIDGKNVYDLFNCLFNVILK